MRTYKERNMCTTCGCGNGEVKIEGQAHDHGHEHSHEHLHANGTLHSHPHTHEGGHAHGHDHVTYGLGAAGAHAPGVSQARLVQIEQDILSRNNEHASQNRHTFSERGIFAVNLVSSPGSGKTTL